MRDHNYFVYIVECADGIYYTGVTSDLENRIIEHNEGVYPKSFTFKRRPVVLKYYQRFTDINDAISWEKQLKGWGRKKKEALFKDDWNSIIELAKSKSKSSENQSSLPAGRQGQAQTDR